METVLQHHIALIRAQASILHRELKENRNRLCQDQALVQGQSQGQGQGQVKNPESTVVLPPSIQKRKPPAESIHTVRLIDNFEMTVMYLLDADGMIQEKNRLGNANLTYLWLSEIVLNFVTFLCSWCVS